MRTLGGVIFTVGMLFFIYNIFMTMRKGYSPQTDVKPAVAGMKA